MNQEILMQGLTVLHLRFHARVIKSIRLEGQPGSAIRGAFYEQLRQHYCSAVSGFATDNHQEECPVCWLLDQEDAERVRGRHLPRPLTVEPPEPGIYPAGSRLSFGITLIGRAQNLLIYILRAAQNVGVKGIGVGRGTFQLEEINEYSPLLDASRSLQEDQRIRQATLHITPARITECANMNTQDRITLSFLTPLRLITEKRLLKQPDPVIFIQRLVERCQELSTYYAENNQPPVREHWIATARELTTFAEPLTIAYNDTQWVEAWSSGRQKHLTPVSGLVGIIRWEGEGISALRPWILWGQSVHVGKDAVKGNGWYRVMA